MVLEYFTVFTREIYALLKSLGISYIGQQAMCQDGDASPADPTHLMAVDELDE